MPIKNAAAIDSNFATPTSTKKEDLIYYNAQDFSVYGVTYAGGIYRRMPYEIAKTVSDNVAQISCECAGGRVRFATNSPYIAIFVKYRSVAKVANYSFTATMGFDLYSNMRYIGSYVPALDTVNNFESVIDLEQVNGVQEYTLNLPVSSEIEELYIGVKKGSQINKGCEYAIKKPVVFYGSSITQGACASRPGNTYPNMISRALDCDYINLGFWGNAMGEEQMARYIAGLDMSAFVYDYDYNSPNAEHLKATHEKMFKIIREANSSLPIIMLTAPRCDITPEYEERIAIIKQTYENAISNGDNKVCFISGPEMLSAVKDTALADNIHPGDGGFINMAKYIGGAIKQFLNKK